MSSAVRYASSSGRTFESLTGIAKSASADAKGRQRAKLKLTIALPLLFVVLLNVPDRVTPFGPQSQGLREIHHLGNNSQTPISLVPLFPKLVMQARDIGAAEVVIRFWPSTGLMCSSRALRYSSAVRALQC
jgi:hypothetical protein